MTASTALTMVVPTLGTSPWLFECLSALAAERARTAGGLAVVVVRQGTVSPALPPGWVDEEILLDAPVGFATAVNRGLAVATTPWVGTLNDDAVVEPGWAATLLAALAAAPRAGAAQGVNLLADQPSLADGWGLAWNRRLQAVQLGHGELALAATEPVREVFGVSATAAVYRREALAGVARPGGGAFDEALGSYYEDAELACRLRGAGWSALAVPAARARHAGSASVGGRRWGLVYGNRYLVLARLLGRGFWPRLPRLVGRDAIDLLRAFARADGATARGVLHGWGRAAARIPRFARRGKPALPLQALGLGGAA